MVAPVEDLRAILLNVDGTAPLAHRFRALFSLKIAGSEGDCKAIEAIADGFKDDSELLKHELAYVLGQTRNLHAASYLQDVLEDSKQQTMVRHEVISKLEKAAVKIITVFTKLENRPQRLLEL